MDPMKIPGLTLSAVSSGVQRLENAWQCGLQEQMQNFSSCIPYHKEGNTVLAVPHLILKAKRSTPRNTAPAQTLGGTEDINSE